MTTLNGTGIRSQTVAIVVDQFPTMSETFIIDQIDALSGRGLHLRIIAGFRSKTGLVHEKGRELASRATYIEDRLPLPKWLPRPLRRRICPASWTLKAYREELRSAAVVLCHFGPVGGQAARALAQDPRPRLWTVFHGYDLSSYVRRFGTAVYAGLFARGDKFFAVSRQWMDRLTQLGCPPERIALMRMGVDVDAIPFVQRTIERRRKLRLLSVCRLVEKKGIDTALRALADLRRSRPELEFCYQVIGDGPLRKQLERLRDELGLADSVVFAGGQPASVVRSQLTEADIFMLPSLTASDGDMEGIPVSLMEAMAAGVPVLSTFHSGIPELVEHQISGLLAAERDYLAFARNICILVDDPAHRSAMTAAARRKIENEFNQSKLWDELAAEILEAAALRP
jgi:colanic acid/amylovoran biosynthesis glycosyltransferase